MCWVARADLCRCFFRARCSGGVHWYSSTVLHSPFIISHIIGLCVHVACRVEWRPVSLFRVGLGRMLGCGLPVSGLFFGHPVCGYLLGCSPVPPRGFDFLTACLDLVCVHAPLVGGCAVRLTGVCVVGVVCSFVVVVVVCRVGVVCRLCPHPPPSKPISRNG
jgi:hypothetical protein